MSHLPTTSERPKKMTVEEYLAFEKASEEKHDYVDGWLIDVRQMAGNTLKHSAIEVNWIAALTSRLRGAPCNVFSSNIKIRSGRRSNYRYPDLSVACKPFEIDPKEHEAMTVLNPSLIIEILSDSTEKQDRGAKFAEYLEIPSFREYVLTSQNSATIETFYRRDDGQWLFNVTQGLESLVNLRSLQLQIPLSEIFAGVTFDSQATVESQSTT